MTDSGTLRSALLVWAGIAILIYATTVALVAVATAPVPGDTLRLVAGTWHFALAILSMLLFVPMLLYVYRPRWARRLAWVAAIASVAVPVALLLWLGDYYHAALARDYIIEGKGVATVIGAAVVVSLTFGFSAQAFAWRARRAGSYSSTRYGVEAAVMAVPLVACTYLSTLGFDPLFSLVYR